MAKVSEALSSMPEVGLQNIRLVRFTMGSDGMQCQMDKLTNKELILVQQMDCAAYYEFGDFWYVIAQELQTGGSQHAK